MNANGQVKADKNLLRMHGAHESRKCICDLEYFKVDIGDHTQAQKTAAAAQPKESSLLVTCRSRRRLGSVAR